MEKKTIKIGVIGAGMHSVSHHGNALKLIRDRNPDSLVLTAVCDLDQQRVTQYMDRFGFTNTYARIKDMLDSEHLDGLIVVTPVDRTADIVEEIFPYGIPFLFEKPPGKNEEEARKIEKMYEEYSTPHMISFNRRFNPAVMKAKEWIRQSGLWDNPKLVLGRMLRNARLEKDFMTTTGIHVVDTLLSFMQVPISVFAKRKEATNGKCISYSGFITDSGESTASILVAPDAGKDEETYEIIGESYDIRIDVFGVSMEVFSDGKTVFFWKAKEDDPLVYRNGAVNEMEYFLDTLRKDENYCPSIKEGIYSVLVAKAIQEGGDTEINSVSDL